MKIGELVYHERMKRFWSQAEFARRAGIGQQHVSKIEMGKLYPRRKTVNKLARALKLTQAQVVASHEPPKR